MFYEHFLLFRITLMQIAKIFNRNRELGLVEDFVHFRSVFFVSDF